MKHCIGIHLLSPEEITRVIIRALRLLPYYFGDQRPPELPSVSDSGRWLQPQVGFIFQEPSSRTIGSLHEAAMLAGFRSSFPMTSESSSLKKNEPPTRATITSIQQKNRVLCFRTTIEGFALQQAMYLEREASRFPDWFREVPIINGGDGRQNHPTQVLLDLTSIIAHKLGFKTNNQAGLEVFKEAIGKMSDDDLAGFIKETLDNLTIAFVGDQSNSRVVGSWLDVGRKFSVSFILVAPSAFKIESWRLEGLKVSPSEDLNDALDADVVYVLRGQMERLEKLMSVVEADSLLRGISVGHSFMERFRGIIMHAQPLDGERPMIDPELWNHPQVIMDFQATVGIPTRVAIFLTCWEGRHEHMPLFQVPPIEPLEVLAEETIEAHRQRLLAKRGDSQRSINPIDRGMVLDRLDKGSGSFIDTLLDRSGVYGRQGSTAIIAKNKPSSDFGRKDIIFLEDEFVPNETLAALTLRAPNLRVIALRDNVYRKMVFDIPPAVKGIFICPNKACITNVDPEAESFLEVVRRGEKIYLHCPSCRHRFKSSQVINQ